MNAPHESEKKLLSQEATEYILAEVVGCTATPETFQKVQTALEGIFRAGVLGAFKTQNMPIGPYMIPQFWVSKKEMTENW
jgi:hypothetical protein